MKIKKINVMSGRERIAYLFLTTIGAIITLIFGIWWFNPSHIPSNAGLSPFFNDLIFALLTYVVWYDIINNTFQWITSFFMKKPRRMKPNEGMNVAFLTAFVPGKEPIELLEKTLKAMIEVEYPHDCWVLDEGNNDQVKILCEKYGVKHFSRFGMRRFNRPEGQYKKKTKAGNFNAWYSMHSASYDFVAQVDVDFAPNKNFLLKTLGYFRDPQVAFVGSPQIYGNTDESWIAKGAAEQAYGFYGTLQRGLFGQDMQLFIGANHVVRVLAHDDIEGYSGHIVEDHLTGMRFYSKKWRSVYVPEILAVGEGPATWDSYFNQQMRWAYGLIDILFTKTPRLALRLNKNHAINYFLLQQYYFFGLAQAIGIFLLTLFFVFNIQATSMSFTQLLSLFVPLLLIQQIISLWLQRFYIDPKNESGLLLRGKLLNMVIWPVYFLALVGVIIRKKLNYVVTPKGNAQIRFTFPPLFTFHLFLGLITLFDLALAYANQDHAPFLVFWAIVNTLVMFGFVFSTSYEIVENYIKSVIRTFDLTLFKEEI